MTRARRAAPLVALAAALGVACGSPPTRTGLPPREEPRREIILKTEAHDRKAGVEISQEVGGELGIVEDAELTRYVGEIGARLARHAPRHRFDYAFRIVDQEEPNAFALPGGFIYVSRGLLALTSSEDELANVIGHEITHVAARHAAARQAILRGVPAPLQFFAMASAASYSRDQEREADRLGQGLSGLAGYDPQGMADFLRKLEFSERLSLGASRLPRFFDTHPAASERVAMAAARAQGIRWRRTPGVVAGRAEHLRRLEGLVVGAAASEGVFRGDRFVHPELDFTLSFPPGWETRNTRRAVGARSPAHDAIVFLEFDSEGGDARAAAAAYLERARPHGLRTDAGTPVRIAGGEAWRVEGSAASAGGSLRVMISWIADRGNVYRIIGATPLGDRYRGTFRNVARSFRRPPPSLISGVSERRLRVVAARAGESLEALGRRTGNEWDIQYTAVANGLYASDRLEAGQLVKVAVAHGYGNGAETRGVGALETPTPASCTVGASGRLMEAATRAGRCVHARPDPSLIADGGDRASANCAEGRSERS